MPAIAGDALRQRVQFYWHLGDFRAIYEIDEDFRKLAGPEVSKLSYLNHAWPDFIENQLTPFQSTPVFLVRGNHELIPPKNTEEYLAQFADWLNAPVIQQQRLKDDPSDHLVKTYYHWVQRGIDFVALDNSGPDQLNTAELAWFFGVVSRDQADPAIKTIVVGMHEPLPDSVALMHSMNDSPVGVSSGRQVYSALLKFLNESHKPVYVIASHNHFYMEDVFNTEYWRKNGGVLPGWIIGTAGAVRYPLPPMDDHTSVAKTDVYGYLLATARPDGTISFEFREIKESDIPKTIVEKYSSEFVHSCIRQNTRVR